MKPPASQSGLPKSISDADAAVRPRSIAIERQRASAVSIRRRGYAAARAARCRVPIARARFAIAARSAS